MSGNIMGLACVRIDTMECSGRNSACKFNSFTHHKDQVTTATARLSHGVKNTHWDGVNQNILTICQHKINFF